MLIIVRAAQVIGDDGDLETQRKDLEAERKAFSEATQRLGEERRRLEVGSRILIDVLWVTSADHYRVSDERYWTRRSDGMGVY